MDLHNQIKILIVDDVSMMRKNVRNNLTQLGFTNLHEAESGLVAWSMIQGALKENSPYEFIIADWNMPQMSGLELLKRVRENPNLEKLPFLMLTAESESSQVILAVKTGVTNFMIKPFSSVIFLDKIQKIFKSES